MCASVFSVRAGFDVDTSHILPQGVVTTITLRRGVIGIGEARACTGCEAGLTVCSVVVVGLLGGARSQVDGVDDLRVRLKLALLPFKCVFLLPALGPLPQRRVTLKQVGLPCLQGSDALPV